MPIPASKQMHLQSEMQLVLAELKAARLRRDPGPVLLLLEERLDELLDAWAGYVVSPEPSG